METDALSRRLRFAPPNPSARPSDAPAHPVLTEADFRVFSAIDRHGPLPTHILYEFVRDIRSYGRFQKRLTTLYHGDESGPYLVRPPQQFASYEAKYQHVVYDLAERARRALAEKGEAVTHRPDPAQPFIHKLMQACACASLEVAVKAAGLEYISRDEILTSGKLGEAARATKPLAVPMRGSTKRLVPDDLFGIRYPEGYRFFALEVDRNTESIERRNLHQNAFGWKVHAYLEVMRQRRFKDWWGLPNLHVLVLTTNATHAKNMLAYLERQEPGKMASYFAFATETSFGAQWRVPREPLVKLFSEPWLTLGGTKHIDRI